MTRGIFDAFNDVITNPLFLGGASLLSGEGMGGAIQGMQAGNQFAMQRRKQQELDQRKAAFEGLLADPSKLGNIPMGAVNLAQAAGYETGVGVLAGMMPKPRDPLDVDFKKAQIDHLNSQTAAARAKTYPGQEFEIRARQAEAYGLTPDHPAYKPYVLTGKFPREDQQPLTATDKKAIIEADDTAQVSKNAIQKLDQALELSKQAYSGPLAETRGYVTGILGSKDGQATQNLSNVVTAQALESLKSIFGGAPTEGERKILLDIQGSVSQPPAVREEIYRRARQMAATRLEFNKRRADEMRGGTYYKPGGNSQESASGSAGVGAPNGQTKTINGKTYINQNGQWYEQ